MNINLCCTTMLLVFLSTSCIKGEDSNATSNLSIFNGERSAEEMSRLADEPRQAAIFYQGNHTTQDLLCAVNATEKQELNFHSFKCQNDEARSVKLKNIPAGTRIMVFDSPNGSMSDDYTIIDVIKQTPYFYEIPSFENNIENDVIKLEHFPVNGLDGNVSHVKVIPPNHRQQNFVIDSETRPSNDFIHKGCLSSSILRM